MKRLFPWWAAALIAFSLALFLRAAIPFSNVFTIDGVNFQESDAWYHIRVVEGFLSGIPDFTQLDPSAGFPQSQRVDVGPLLDLLVVCFVKLTGMDPWIAAAWCPVVLWIGIIIALGFLARELFSPLHALLAVTLCCLFGGHFLRVTSLGFHDHHVLEALLYVLILLTLPGPRYWLSGLVLASYLLTFLGGALLVGFLIFWRLFTPSAPNLWRTYALAILLLLPFHQTLWVDYSLASLFAALLLELLYLFVARPGHRYIVIGLATIPILWACYQFNVLKLARHFTAGSGAATIAEMQRLSPSLIWQSFGVFGPFALTGFAQMRPANSAPALRLLAFTGLGFIVTSLFQVRLTYYVAIPVALFASAAIAPLLSALARPIQLGAPALLLLAATPTLYNSYTQNTRNNGFGADWRDAFAWLRYQTPSPLPPEQSYPRLLPWNPDHKPASSSYGVLAWWDFGYGLTTLAQRPPFTNPTQRNAELAARILLNDSAEGFISQLRQFGLRYAILNDAIPMMPRPNGSSVGIFDSIVTWAGYDLRKYYEVLNYRKPDGTTTPITVFHPAYYRTAAVRLTLFGLDEYTPRDGICTATREANTISNLECFQTLAQAEARLRILPSGILFGGNSIQSPLPLPRWSGLKIAYQSREKTAIIAERFVPAITIYQQQQE